MMQAQVAVPYPQQDKEEYCKQLEAQLAEYHRMLERSGVEQRSLSLQLAAHLGKSEYETKTAEALIEDAKVIYQFIKEG